MTHISLGRRMRSVADSLGGLFRGPARARMPPLDVVRIDGYEGYLGHARRNEGEWLRRQEVERRLLSPDEPFQVAGYCQVCAAPSQFVVDYRYGSEMDGVRWPNWRESLVCGCGLSNRLRASLHLFDLMCQPQPDASIYITEQTTPIYRALLRRWPDLIGSEYLGARVPFGATDTNGIRNESLTRLSFPDERFDFILSFDVFEHIPEVEKALAECRRCLKPGGALLFSVPFIANAPETLVRARTSDTGILHLLPPEYHGDPMAADGCLCFYHFGWDLLDKLRSVGFGSAEALLYWSRELGYLGGEQILFLARR